MKNKRFKIQNLIFYYNSKLEEHWWLMNRGSRMHYDSATSSCYLNPGDFAEYFTYFNSFSLGKWKKYTNAGDIYLHLRCKGNFTVRLFGHYRGGQDIKKEMYEPHIFNLKELTDIDIPIPSDSMAQAVGFQIEVKHLTETERLLTEKASKTGKKAPDFRFQVESGSWETIVPEDIINDVRISIATTTFKKEEYIKRNIDVLERELFYSDEACREHFRLRVVDNGRTLDPEKFNSEFVTVFPNDNVGGAGGFCRGMIESRNGEEKPTHILLMDDDVIILPEALIRTYSLLALMKDEYKHHFISGAMLKAEQMNEQHEDAAYFTDEGFGTPAKPLMFLHLWDHVFKNEEEIPEVENSYCAWWYCCMPITAFDKDDLPLPIFIRGDDIDFGVRHKAKIITLNGIFVWHNDFKYKFTASMEFYMVNRNALATQAMDGIFQNSKIIQHIDDWFWQRICSLDYCGCDLLLDAIDDYLKGPDFFRLPNGEQIVKEKAQKNEKMKPIQFVCKELDNINLNELYNDLYSHRELKGFKKFLYKLTKNGHFMPKIFLKKNTAVIPFDWFWFEGPEKQYLANQVLAVSINGTANLRIRSRRRFLQLVNRRKKLMKKYKKENKRIVEMYSEAAKTFRSEEFWKGYLGI